MGVNVPAHTRHIFLGSAPPPGASLSKINIFNERHMYGKRKSGVFFAGL